MDIIIPTIALLFIAVLFNKIIKKHFTILSILIIIFTIFAYLNKNLEGNVLGGYTGFAFFIIVMFQSAFKKRSLLYKKTLSVRKEYSIFGFIFVIPHSIIFLLGQYQYLEWNGIIAVIFMIPLFITSFILIRKKMKPEQWIKLHLLSYVVYILIFAHIIFVATNQHRILYLLLLLLYLFLKIKNNGFYKLDTIMKKSIAIIIMLLTLTINLYIYNENNNIIDNNNYQYINDTYYEETPEYEGQNIQMDVTIDNDENNNDIIINTESYQYANGTYYGEAPGFKELTVQVNVTVDNDEIVNIEILSSGASKPHKGVDFEESVNFLKDQIITYQSVELDTISGATISTNGLKEAVNKALEQAILEK